ncbi:MAG: YigZ family protein [Cyclobacteriaceae bacterium]
MDSYLTIGRTGEGFYKEKGSKFIAVALRASSEDEVAAHLSELRKQYYDARHHCYGYSLGIAELRTRANDDGEPNHSAGDPILGQIKSFDVRNTLVVVVRYFGGTKLGVGGLINAYRTAATSALENAAIVEKKITQKVEVRFPYTETSEVMRKLNELPLDITDQEFTADCLIKGEILKSQSDRLPEAFALNSLVKVSLL